MISTSELSDASSSGSAESDLISWPGQPYFLDGMWPSPQGLSDLIDLEYETAVTGWPVERQQYATSNDDNWVKTPTTDSHSDSKGLQSNGNSLLSPDDHTHFMIEPPPPKRLSNPKEKKHKSLSFACPFYRGNPWKYHMCQKYDLQRIKDVRQHIHRKHVKPNFYCTRCYEVFVDANSRDDHARYETCVMRREPKFDGITDSQKGELRECHKRGKEITEQWYYMWDILFKDQPRPKSPYIGNYREEMGPLIRDFWNSKRVDIISNAPAPDDQGVFDYVMDIVLKHYESDSTNTNMSTKPRQKDCAQMQRVLPDPADTAVMTQISISEAVRHVGMVHFDCLATDFNPVANSAVSNPVQCLPDSDIEVDFNFENFDQEQRDSSLVY
jgi:hypothetical protein